MSSKGFVHTLEAILAAALILGTVVSVIPQFRQQPGKLVIQERAFQGLKSVERSGRLTHNVSPRKVENEVEPYIPESYNFSAVVTSLRNESGSLTAPGEEKLSVGTDPQLLIWVESAEDLNATYSGTYLFKNQGKEEYFEFSIDGDGWLNLTGIGRVDYRAVWYRSEGKLPSQDDLFTANYLFYENRSREIKIGMWRE